MSNYLITGATGYLGSYITKYLLNQGNQVTTIVRHIERMDKSIRHKVKSIEMDICKAEVINKVVGNFDYIIHCAAPTKSSYMMTNPVEVADAIVNGTQNMLKLAKQCNVKSMVYLSSMEVYGEVKCLEDRRVKEEEIGQLDIYNVRNCYPMAKRMAENYCYLYFKEYGVPVKIARLSQTFGRGVSPNDTRVFMQFAKAAINETDIILHTKGNSVGNYCSIDETINGILFLLEHGQSGEAYNIVNEANTMTIKEMAELVVKEVTGGKIGIKYDIPKENMFGYATETGLRLSGEKIKKLGWEAKVSLSKMYQDMIEEQKLSRNIDI